MNAEPMKLLIAAAVRDARGVMARPGAVLTLQGRVVEAGALEDLPARLVARAERVYLPEHLILPLMVNAHAHLDLTLMGSRVYGGDFFRWLREVMANRPTEPAAVAEAVEAGLAMSQKSGVGWVGDIAGSAAAIAARHAAPPRTRLPGVSYLECFGRGSGVHDVVERVDQTLASLPFEMPVPNHSRGVVLGISPHAPYSAGRELYDAVTRLSQKRIYRLSTHLAESQAELEFVRDAAGPFAEMLREMGKWDETIWPTGLHPIDWLRDELRHGRWLLAHCNYVEDEHLALLRRKGASVVYCPVASDYFGHRGHRYREMLDEGVTVCLGTDSILCQPGDAPGCQPMGILGQMRYLYRRDETNPRLLLRMATVNGMIAMEFHESDATLGCGAPATFCAVRIDPDGAKDPLVQALENDEPAEVVGY